jgi:hypothetical protein
MELPPSNILTGFFFYGLFDGGFAKSAIPSLSRASGRYSKDEPGFVPTTRYAREY